MNLKAKIIIATIYTLLMLVIGGVVAFKIFPPKEVETVVVKTEYRPTAPIKVDTSPINLSRSTWSKFILLPSVPDTLYKGDTVYITQSPKDSLPVMWENKHYSDSTFDAWVSGISPSLDSIKTYSTGKLIKEIQYKDRWVLGPYIGTEIGTLGSDIKAGLGVSIPAERWKIDINGGYKLENTGSWRHGPYLEVKATYNILFR